MKRINRWSSQYYKRYISYYKVGGFTLLIISIILYLFAQLYQLLVLPIYQLTGSIVTAILLILIIPPLLGLLLASNTFRFHSFLDRFSEKYPRTARIVHLLSPGDIKENSFPEVKVEVLIDNQKIRILGYVVQEYREHDEIWCRVAIPTFPIAVHGNFIEVQKQNLIYTGRNVQDTALTLLSFGTK